MWHCSSEVERLSEKQEVGIAKLSDATINKTKEVFMAKNKSKQAKEKKLPVGSEPVERKRTVDTGPTDSTGMVPEEAKKDK